VEEEEEEEEEGGMREKERNEGREGGTGLSVNL